MVSFLYSALVQFSTFLTKNFRIISKFWKISANILSRLFKILKKLCANVEDIFGQFWKNFDVTWKIIDIFRNFLNFVRTFHWNFEYHCLPEKWTQELQKFAIFEITHWEWKSMFTLRLNAAKNTDYIKKWFKQKFLLIKFPQKTQWTHIFIFPRNGARGAPKICQFLNIIMHWNDVQSYFC